MILLGCLKFKHNVEARILTPKTSDNDKKEAKLLSQLNEIFRNQFVSLFKTFAVCRRFVILPGESYSGNLQKFNFYPKFVGIQRKNTSAGERKSVKFKFCSHPRQIQKLLRS